MSYLETVDAIARSVVTEHAAEVDEAAAFPEASLAALREAGLLGLVSSEDVGGLGEGVREAALTVERIARECGSTAMVVCMRYAGTAVLEKVGPEALRRQNAAGEHLLTLAFSEAGGPGVTFGRQRARQHAAQRVSRCRRERAG